MINARNVKKILALVDQGLSHGLGKPEPGKMCVEAAVCSVLEGRHGDDPACVGSAVREFKINLNDQNWSTNAARAAGLRRLAIAQLGSDTISQEDFVAALALGTVTEILPLVLPAGKERDRCAAATTLKEARSAADAAVGVGGNDVGDAAEAAYRAVAYPAGRTIATAIAEVAFAAYAANAPAADDHIRCASAELAVQILISMNCPGTKFLKLTEE
ncbi:MAG TPA: hypothetical protein VMT67_00135 [Terriglobales bacterium]|nr:hypothetical protein [Terriglobales bacterium]